MRAELAHLIPPEQEPEDREHFTVTVTAYIGSVGSFGADLFEFTICTPSWLASNAKMPKGYWFPRHHLIVREWDERLVERAIRDLCLRTEGEDWAEVALKLSRYGHWEFEDYRPYTP